MASKRVAIIGAGPAGLAQLCAFQSMEGQKGDKITEIVCFEGQSNLGGQWNYDGRKPVADENGEPVHSSMYDNMWINGPKELSIELPDYTFDEHFGRPVPSYIPREVVHAYFKARAKKRGIQESIRFNSAVRQVMYDEVTQMFTITVENLVEKRQSSDEFDYVVVATGHFSTPHRPNFAGFDKFPGRILHSHDFRNAKEFTGQNILLIGASDSAEDIALQCYKYGSKSVTISYRSRPLEFSWPGSIEQVPLLKRMKGKKAVFRGGRIVHDIETIILCTGYLHHFPFLEENLRLKASSRLWPLNLYKGVAWVDNPKLMYLGMQELYFSCTLLEAQAWFARDVILGRIEIPDRASMIKDNMAWRREEHEVIEDEDAIYFQAKYIKMLIEATGFHCCDIDSLSKASMEWVKHRNEDLLTYRDHAFRSLYTGTMAVEYPTPWLKAKDPKDMYV